MNHQSTLNIILIEDDPTLRMLYRRALCRVGHRVHEQGRGDDGLRLALAMHCDLIILDWHLPGLNGFQVLSALRKGGRRIPIIMLSGSGAQARVDAIRAGADAFLDKPCGMDEILAAVEQVTQPILAIAG